MPVKGLNLFSRSNCCFPRTPRSTCRSGQIAQSSIVLLIWKILSVIASGAGPGNQTANSGSFCTVDMEIQRAQSSSTPPYQHICHATIQAAKSEFSKRKYYVNDHSCTAPHTQVQQNEKHLIFTKRKQKAPLLRIRTGTLTSQGLGYQCVLQNIKLAILKMTANSPPLEILNLIPKSPLGPPGLWLAVRMIPPMALIFLMMQDTAGVERIPFCPITKRPIQEKKSRTHTLMLINPELLHRNARTARWTKKYSTGQEKMSFNEHLTAWVNSIIIPKQSILLLSLSNIITEVESALLNKAIPSDSFLGLCSV